MANRLSGETSPYLLQHAQNPVDWYPWGTEAIERARLDLCGGVFNFRLQRGGSNLSIHSWGAAIDIDPERNRLGRRYSAGAGMIPRAAVDIFEAEGWEWGGRWSRPDAMHFQAARTGAGRAAPRPPGPSAALIDQVFGAPSGR